MFSVTNTIIFFEDYLMMKSTNNHSKGRKILLGRLRSLTCKKREMKNNYINLFNRNKKYEKWDDRNKVYPANTFTNHMGVRGGQKRLVKRSCTPHESCFSTKAHAMHMLLSWLSSIN